MTVLTFTQADGLYTNGVIDQTNPFSVEDNKLKADSIASTNDARILFQSAADGSFSADISTLTPTLGNNVGVVFRGVDLDNNWQAFFNFSQNRVRLIKLVNGTGSPVYDDTLGGYGTGETRNIGVECLGDQIVLKQDGNTLHTETDATFQSATLAGLRMGNTAYRADNLTFPDAATGTLSKLASFDISSSLQGVSDVYFTLTTIPFGDSITSGALDTSAATVTLNLDAFSAVNVGDTLCLLASDKQLATDATDIIAWPTAVVVEG